MTVEAIAPPEKGEVDAWVSVFDVKTRFVARLREGVDGWIKDFLSSKDYKATPTIAQLREDLASKAAWWSKPEQLRARIEAALQAAALYYLALNAPDHVLAGWASRATSPAVAKTPGSLSQN